MRIWLGRSFRGERAIVFGCREPCDIVHCNAAFVTSRPNLSSRNFLNQSADNRALTRENECWRFLIPTQSSDRPIRCVPYIPPDLQPSMETPSLQSRRLACGSRRIEFVVYASSPFAFLFILRFFATGIDASESSARLMTSPNVVSYVIAFFLFSVLSSTPRS